MKFLWVIALVLVFLGCKPKNQVITIPPMISTVQLPPTQVVTTTSNATQSANEDFTSICRSLFTNTSSTASVVSVTSVNSVTQLSLFDTNPASDLGLEVPAGSETKYEKLKKLFPPLLDKLTHLQDEFTAHGCTDPKFQAYAFMLKQEALNAQKAGPDFLAKAALNFTDLTPNSSTLSPASLQVCRQAMVQGMQHSGTNTSSSLEALQNAVDSAGQSVGNIIGKSIAITSIIIGSILTVYGGFTLVKFIKMEKDNHNLQALQFLENEVVAKHGNIDAETVDKIKGWSEDPLVADNVKKLLNDVGENYVRETRLGDSPSFEISFQDVNTLEPKVELIQSEVKSSLKSERKMKAGWLGAGISIVLSSVLVHQLVFNLVQDSFCTQIVDDLNKDLQSIDTLVSSSN